MEGRRMSFANGQYVNLLNTLRQRKDSYQVSRGAGVTSIFGYSYGPVVSCPIITFRKTAWKTALKELEWFMSGENTCPEGVLRDVWWKGQLGPDNKLLRGYPSQLRRSQCSEGDFDQVAWLREELKANPSSRRLCLTVWNPGTMALLQDINQNDMVPASCHLVYNQFSVRNDRLHMNAIFRSTDAVLGLPHNLVQHRALQLYFAHHAGVKAEPYYSLYLNDVHYYDHPDHLDFINYVAENKELCSSHGGHGVFNEDNEILYTPTSLEFKAEDFSVVTKLPDPIYTKRIERTL